MKIVWAVCATLLFPISPAARADETRPGHEPLLGLRVSSRGITYYVHSTGCTKKGDFEVYLLESFPPQLQLVRIKPDQCNTRVPDGTAIFYRWDEVGLTKGFPFKVINPLENFVVPE